jgi:hypothetical protein
MTSWNPVAPEAVIDPTKLPFGCRIVTSATGIVFPDTDIVTSSPAVAVNDLTAFSPTVPIVTVVAWPIAVVPVFCGTELSKNVNEPTF